MGPELHITKFRSETDVLHRFRTSHTADLLTTTKLSITDSRGRRATMLLSLPNTFISGFFQPPMERQYLIGMSARELMLHIINGYQAYFKCEVSTEFEDDADVIFSLIVIQRLR